MGSRGVVSSGGTGDVSECRRRKYGMGGVSCGGGRFG